MTARKTLVTLVSTLLGIAGQPDRERLRLGRRSEAQAAFRAVLAVQSADASARAGLEAASAD